MHEIINEKVGVVTVYSRTEKLNMPVRLKWQGKVYSLDKLGYHHKYRQGRVTIHVFSVSNKDLAFRLEFNTEDLTWTLMEVSDGLTN